MEIPWVLRVWTETIKFIRFSSIPPCSLALFSLIFFFWNNIVKKSPFEISKRSVRCGKFPGFCLFKRKKKKKNQILLPYSLALIDISIQSLRWSFTSCERGEISWVLFPLLTCRFLFDFSNKSSSLIQEKKACEISKRAVRCGPFSWVLFERKIS